MQLGGLQRGKDGQGDPRPDALDMGEQPIPVPLFRAGEADKADRILRHQHFGVDRHRFAHRTKRGERARGRPDQIADAADIDHGMVDARAVETALEFRNHARCPMVMICSLQPVTLRASEKARHLLRAHAYCSATLT